MEKFEYKILEVSRTNMQRDGFQAELLAKLNELGAQGWDLITIEGMNEGSVFLKISETVDILFVFKRKRSN